MGSRVASGSVAPSPLQIATEKIYGPRAWDGTYVGACGFTYRIRDDARVLYFDDPVLDDVVAITRPHCGPLRRCLCGARGQAVRVQNRICWGWCTRARGPGGLPCIPTCCVCLCKPAALCYDMPAMVGKRKYFLDVLLL